MPANSERIAQEARAAVQRAWKAGIKRQRLDLLLPLIGATDLDDWPGGVRQQFKAVLPMVESMLAGLKSVPGLEGPLSGEIWDQGDAVGAWTGKAMNVIVFPTGDIMSRMIKMVEQNPDSLVILVNPQWALSQQVISDFGVFGRNKAEAFLSKFEDTYCLKSYTIRGDSIRVLRCYPGQWQVHLVNPATGEDSYICSMEERPSYKLLQDTVEEVEGSNSSKSFVERIRREIQFNQESLTKKK